MGDGRGAVVGWGAWADAERGKVGEEGPPAASANRLLPADALLVVLVDDSLLKAPRTHKVFGCLWHDDVTAASHASHPRSMTVIGPASPARRSKPDGGRPGGGPTPSRSRMISAMRLGGVGREAAAGAIEFGG